MTESSASTSEKKSMFGIDACEEVSITHYIVVLS